MKFNFVKEFMSLQRKRPRISAKQEYQEEIPLTLEQRRLWFLNEINPSNTAYNMCIPIRITGMVQAHILEQAMNEIINRHDAFRMTFFLKEEVPRIKIHQQMDCKIVDKDFRSLGEQAKKTSYDWITEFTKIPFDLVQGPLIRAALARYEDSGWYFVIIVHHIIIDGWSTGVLLEQLSQLYETFLLGKPLAISEQKIQFSDYILYQNDLFTDVFLDEQMEYWRNKLPESIQDMKLPKSYPQIQRSAAGKVSRIILPPSIMKGIYQLKKLNQELSVYMILVAALRILLFKYTGEKELIIGSPLANRNSIDIRDTIGYFANIILLYTSINSDDTFEQFLIEEMTTILEAYLHQEMPLEYLVQEYETSRDLNRNPLFQVAITYQKANDNQYHFGDGIGEVVEIERNGAIFNMTFMLYERDGGIDGWIEYNSSLYSEVYIDKMIQHYLNILEQVIIAPEIKIKDIEILSKLEKDIILNHWNSTEHVYSYDKTMHGLFAEKATLCPDNIAISYNNVTISYQELNAESNRICHYLIDQGAVKEQIIAVLMRKTPEMIAVLLGILKAGCVYLPIDYHYPVERIGYMLKDSQAVCLITDNEFEFSQAININIINYFAKKEYIINCYSGNDANVMIDSQQLAYIIYTSGTSGNPKGVMIRHNSAVNLIEWLNRQFLVNEQDRLLFVTSYCFDLSVYDIFGILAAGGQIEIVNEMDIKDPKKLLKLICQKEITIWDSAPALMNQLNPYFSGFEAIKASKMRLILLSGDWITLKLAKALRFYFDNAQLIAMGGATEATIWSNYYVVDEVKPEWISIPYGVPIQNSKYYILDKNHQVCPINVEGDLYISGICLANGYLNNVQLTMEKFIPNRFHDNEYQRMYYTGDRACYREDGNIEFLGRKDGQVKIRGFRVELEEIRNKLMEYPALGNAVVTVFEEQEENKLMAYLVPKKDGSLSVKEIRGFLRNKLPDYMIPVYYQQVEQIILNTNGKIDIEATQKAALPVVDKVQLSNDITILQREILTIWKALLQKQEIALDSNFFDLGGSSMLVAQLVYKIKEKLDIELEVKHIFIYPTVQALVDFIENNDFSEEYIDLNAELLVNPNQRITINQDTLSYPNELKHILLTGSTGFIGRFLLHELLEKTSMQIYCLIKAESSMAGWQRIRTMLQENQLWQETYQNRIEIVLGDLAEPGMGIEQVEYERLASIIDGIYHNGAVANYLAHYDSLKGSNVEGTKEIVKFASLKKIKVIHFSSTITVFNSGVGKVVNEFTSIKSEAHVKFPGYFASKWISEAIINDAREKGIPCNIYRFGLIIGDTQKGRYDNRQWFYLLIKSIFELGYTFDEMPDLNHAIMPVDIAVKHLVNVSQKQELYNGTFYLCNPQRVPVHRLVERYNQFIDKKIEMLPFYDWIQIAKAAVETGKSVPFLPFIQHLANLSAFELNQWQETSSQLKLEIDCTYSQMVYQEIESKESFLTDDMIKKCFDYVLNN